jgi:aryl-alcohol dehydrogenase-like predicted oxidoreductase
VLGNALEGYDRDWSVVASKVYNPMDEENPNAQGLSRKAIEQELENSLDRLGMDTIDLYQTHRWDYTASIEDTIRTLNDAVRRGKARYIGATSLWAHQFAEALYTSERLGVERFATMQNHYNLVYREEEREMLPLCAKEDIGVLPWSPLARGYLARPHDTFDTTARGEYTVNRDDYMPDRVALYHDRGGAEINERVKELAAEYDASMAQIAIAWLLQKEWVDAPIVGTTSVHHLEDAVEALDIALTDSDVDWLEEPYQPVEIVGHE